MSKSLQMTALGLEDYFITGNDNSNSFLQPIYEKHQNFSTESIEIRSNEKLNFSNQTSGTKPFVFNISGIKKPLNSVQRFFIS